MVAAAAYAPWSVLAATRRCATARCIRHNAERQQPLPGRAGLNLRTHSRAYAALEARGPPAVIDLFRAGRIDGREPVLPQPVALQAGVEVIPRQDLVVAPFPRRVPVKVQSVGRERAGRALFPAL